MYPVRPPLCPYCGKLAELVSEKEWYGGVYDKLGRPRWACWSCRASVGTHPDGSPFGPLAKKELSDARRNAKIALTEIFPNKHERYPWLSQQMGLPLKNTHVGMFNLEQCQRVVELCDAEKRSRSG